MSESQQVILSLYRAAENPEHYESTVDDWAHWVNESSGPDEWVLAGELLQHFAFAQKLITTTVEGFDDPLANEPHPAFALNERCQVAAVNDGARRLLGIDAGIDLRDVQLLSDSHERLSRLVTRLFDSGPELMHGLLHAVFNEGGQRRRLVVGLYRRQFKEQALVVCRISRFSWHKALQKAVQQALNLTHRELDIVRLMCQGKSAKQVADMVGSSPATVRTQTNAIYRKNNINSQLELTFLVTQICDISGFVSPLERSLPAGWVAGLPADILSHETLNDGAVLSYYDVGPADGLPLVYLHGNVFGYRLSPALEKGLRDKNVRLLCPVRPGYGRSTAVPESQSFYDGTVAALSQWMKQLNLTNALLVGEDAGAVFALGLAEAEAQRVQHVTMVSTPVPLPSTAVLRKLNKWGKAIVQAACLHPSALHYFAKVGFQYARVLGPKHFMRSIFYNSPIDKQITDDEAHMNQLIVGSRVIIEGGYLPHSQDVLLSVSDWRETFYRCQHPITLIHGGQDVFWDVDSVAEMAASKQGATLHRMPQAGHLPLYVCPEVLLDVVESCRPAEQCENSVLKRPTGTAL